MDLIENEIKSFCFHEKVRGESMKTRNKTNKIIKTAFSTRGESFHWAFGFVQQTGDEPHQTLQLQGMNCEKCGNYLFSMTMFERIICNCIETAMV
jgi:hypothetical protein